MIKRLRLKFLAVSMILITAMLLVMIGLICQFSWMNLKNSAISELRTVTDMVFREKPDDKVPGDKKPEDAPDDKKPEEAKGEDKKPGMLQTPWSPFFVLQNMEDGQLKAVGGSIYDLTNTELLQHVLDEARNEGKTEGILPDRSLVFLRLEGDDDRYAFMEITNEQKTFRALIFNCHGIGLLAFLVFFGIMWVLSKWMVRPVEEAWDRQRQFVADASHELKTPLTVILTNAELLQSDEFDQETKSRFTTGIHSMAVQMRGLVEYLLNQARVDHGDVRINQTKLDLSTLVEEAALPFEAVYFEAGKNLESHIEPGIQTTGSYQHLCQVLEILLDNGCKYSDPGTEVTLRLHRQGNHRAVVSVTSQGQTLTAKQCEDIFKRFYRLDAARKMNHSYGLGLAIAQTIVEAHRGRIWCESKQGKTIFYVNLPI